MACKRHLELAYGHASVRWAQHVAGESMQEMPEEAIGTRHRANVNEPPALALDDVTLEAGQGVCLSGSGLAGEDGAMRLVIARYVVGQRHAAIEGIAVNGRDVRVQSLPSAVHATVGVRVGYGGEEGDCIAHRSPTAM
jgi:hypothetical protein